MLAIAIKILVVGKKAISVTGTLICSAVAVMIITQVVVNVGMVLKLLPVVGITLPFISAGGPSVVSLDLAVGLVLSVYRSSGTISYDNDYRFDRIARQV